MSTSSLSSFCFSYWTAQHSLFGKVATILFYSLVWFMILTSLYSVLSPASEGTNCILDELHDDDYTLVILNGLIRVLNWFGVGFFVALLLLPNLQVAVFGMTIIMCGAWINNKFFMERPATTLMLSLSSSSSSSLLLDSPAPSSLPSRISQECWDSVLAFNAIFAGVSVLIAGLVVVELLVVAVCNRRSGANNREAGNEIDDGEKNRPPAGESVPLLY